MEIPPFIHTNKTNGKRVGLVRTGVRKNMEKVRKVGQMKRAGWWRKWAATEKGGFGRV